MSRLANIGAPADAPAEAARPVIAATGAPPVAGRSTGRHAGRKRRWPRWLPPPRVLLAILIVVALAVVVLRARSAEHDLATAVRHFMVRRLPWLGLALAAESLSFVCYALVQRRLLRAGGARLTVRTMLSLAIAATGVTNLVPGGTAPASGWLVGQYRRRGIPMPLALWAVLAGGFAATVSVLLLLLIGAGIAGLIGLLPAIGCAVLLFGGAAGLVAGLQRVTTIEGWLAEHHARRGLSLVRRIVAATSGVVRFRLSPPGGAQVLLLSLANWTLDVVCLIAAFALLGLPIPWHAVLFAYATAQVAGSLAPVPGGVGFVEGGMIGAFALAGTPAGDALVATVVYRLITCWAVAAIGSLMLLIVSRRESPHRATLEREAAALAGSDPDTGAGEHRIGGTRPAGTGEPAGTAGSTGGALRGEGDPGDDPSGPA